MIIRSDEFVPSLQAMSRHQFLKQYPGIKDIYFDRNGDCLTREGLANAVELYPELMGAKTGFVIGTTCAQMFMIQEVSAAATKNE